MYIKYLRHLVNLGCDSWLKLSFKTKRPTTEVYVRSIQLVRRYPYWSGGHYLVGTSALEKGDIKLAYGSAHALRKLEPDQAGPWILMARCRLAGHQFEKAEEEARKALEIDPLNKEAIEELAAALIPLDRLKEAFELIQTIPLAERNVGINSMLAYLEHNRGS